MFPAHWNTGLSFHREWQIRLQIMGRGQDVRCCSCGRSVLVWICSLTTKTNRGSSLFSKSSKWHWQVSTDALIWSISMSVRIEDTFINTYMWIFYWLVFFMDRFCRRCRWLWDIKGPWCGSLPGGRGEVYGCGSMSAVPGELQLWNAASVSLPTRLPASRSAPRAPSGNPAQGWHTHSGSVSGQAGRLPAARPPFTGMLYSW